jgi:hypothetical protein
MGPTDPANCCCDEEGGGDPLCQPFGWINPCSVGYYVSDRCETNFFFRIKKNGEVIYGSSDANSYSLTPPFGEVAEYTIEVCEGPEPCTWTRLIGPTAVDTTDEEACPMGIYGQTYIVGTRPSDNETGPMSTYVYCQSQMFVRVSALAAPGQVITHLWIDDVLYTPNTNYAGGLHTEPDGSLPFYAFHCHSGRSYNHAYVPWNDTSLPHQRLALPIPFTKGTFSIRARQTNGMIVGCNVGYTCTAHYNAASVTLPSWSGMSFACSANGGMPFGFMNNPTGPTPRIWCQHFETSLDIVPTSPLGGTFSWITCHTLPSPSMVVGTFQCTYRFKCNGLIRWIDPDDPPPRFVYSGTYLLDHTVTWSVKLVLGAAFSPGALTVGDIDALIDGDITSTLTGHIDWPAELMIRAGGINWFGVPGLNDVYEGDASNNRLINPNWFVAELVDGLGCGPPPFDEELFRWRWIGPRFPRAYWSVEVPEMLPSTLVPSPFIDSGGFGSTYTNAVWPAGTNFYCDLSEDSPYGGYYFVTASAIASQFQV